MLLKGLCQLNVVKVVKSINTSFKSLIVLFWYQKSIESFIDSFVVEVLDRPQVWFDQLEMIVLGEEVDCPCVIQSGGEDKQQVIE